MTMDNEKISRLHRQAESDYEIALAGGRGDYISSYVFRSIAASNLALLEVLRPRDERDDNIGSAS